MEILRTERLTIRELTLADTNFVLELLNEPAFIQFIGDKGARDLAGAEKYLREGPLASYAKHGFGLWRVALQADDTPVGMCGLLKRDALDYPDLGYALLARFGSRGYAHEAAAAVLVHARKVLQLGPLFAVTAQENPASIRLLQKLGFKFEGLIPLPGYPEESRLFVLGL